ncbi:MAG: ANTAR domain-containing protein [Candidatus Margulisbacteria bacterium]|nr:ANTAR domain-containing protein [Candidatus Margulisiibacteriota bacterium]MBU1021302.1 ANTAR domain-containing protein [Candidatus Margulisiibacteriota bacterium]MBU1729209.1 ANTAR domain-containing protein [Candidatus Margulisiibacteriota bacterium]MBU1954882.1 ANTAR domain-containing protein [Candidatus Margulisiibacteriota bacterium]
MLNSRQEEIINILREYPYTFSRQLVERLGISRARLNQLMIPLIKNNMVKMEGHARATCYSLAKQKKANFRVLELENAKLKKQVKELQRQLEDRKIIERAKEILMAQFDIRPTEAYRKLQEQSMSRRKSMRQVAESILGAYEV